MKLRDHERAASLQTHSGGGFDRIGTASATLIALLFLDAAGMTESAYGAPTIVTRAADGSLTAAAADDVVNALVITAGATTTAITMG